MDESNSSSSHRPLQLVFNVQLALLTTFPPPQHLAPPIPKKSKVAFNQKCLQSEETKLSYYDILSIPHDATALEIKAAYHRALLLHHPDKRCYELTSTLERKENGVRREEVLEVSLIKEAYDTLASPEKRAEYDASLRKRRGGRAVEGVTGPRPAQVVSLEEWTSVRCNIEATDAKGGDEEEDEGPWRYPCRCSGFYEISVVMMEKGVHLVGCSSCSEVVWAGYEVGDDSDEHETEP